MLTIVHGELKTVRSQHDHNLMNKLDFLKLMGRFSSFLQSYNGFCTESAGLSRKIQPSCRVPNQKSLNKIDSLQFESVVDQRFGVEHLAVQVEHNDERGEQVVDFLRFDRDDDLVIEVRQKFAGRKAVIAHQWTDRSVGDVLEVFACLQHYVRAFALVLLALKRRSTDFARQKIPLSSDRTPHGRLVTEIALVRQIQRLLQLQKIVGPVQMLEKTKEG